MIGRLDFFSHVRFAFFPILTPLFLPSLSVSFSYFILAVPMRECLGKHPCISSTFPIGYSHTEWYVFFFRQRNNYKRRTFRIRSEKVEILFLLVLVNLYLQTEQKRLNHFNDGWLHIQKYEIWATDLLQLLLLCLGLCGRAGPLPNKGHKLLVPWGTEAIPASGRIKVYET